MELLKWVQVLIISTIFTASYGQENVQYPEDYCQKIKDDEEFDFVIVGAGPAGCAFARRIAEVSSWNILVLEAGGDPTPESDIPSNSFSLIGPYRWNFTTERSQYNCRGTLFDGRCIYGSGMILGGSGTINEMMAVRGSRADFDEWAELGNKGWSYDDVLPYFKKLENFLALPITDTQTNTTVSNKYHSKGGPQDVSYFQVDERTKAVKEAIIEAAALVGIPFNSDINGENQLGFTRLPGFVNKQGIRQNPAKSYLLNIPDNLKICKNAMVTKVILDGKKATGVEYQYPVNGLTPLPLTKRVKAAKEVTVCAGPLNSGPLLERSGIGQPDVLRKAGVEPIHDLPGVGENFQEQFINVGSAFHLDLGSSNVPNQFSIGATDLTGFVATKGGNVSDVQFILTEYNPIIGQTFGYTPEIQTEYERESTMIFGPCVLRQQKPGYIHITQSKSPRISPKFDTRQYEDPEDIEVLVTSTRMAREIMSQDALKPFKVRPLVLKQCKRYPYNSDEEIICMARLMGTTLYHLAGPTSMGPACNKMAVVNDRLKVHGIENLRVVDSGIMPKVTRGNTEFPSLMIGEKGAHIVKEDYGFI